MAEFNTFWEIITNQGIEIPPIQRDYAQGRKSEKIDKIRSRFINSIFTALKTDDFLRLDFIYGKIYGIRNDEEHRRNKSAIDSLLKSVKDYATSIDLTFNDIEIKDKSENKADLLYLIPLDGQQRLTALFLIHWYICKRLELKQNIEILKRFKYKTRKSSYSFINLICSDIEIDFNKTIYDEIIKLEHFSNTWFDDPTVTSILVVLNDIHELFKLESKENILKYWQHLTIDKKIFFDFLNLKDFNLSDELYVKMNARGKELSDFENFKAWQFGEIEERELFDDSVLDKYKNQFDIQWNDIFWNLKKIGDYEIDTVYLNFFKLSFIYDLLKIAPLSGTNFKESNYLNRINTIQKNSLMDFEKDFDNLFFENIGTYYKILEICSSYIPEDTILSDFFKFYFSKEGIAPTWRNIIKHYAVLSYIFIKSKKLVDYSPEEKEALNDYYRILMNLFNNTVIDNPSLYKNAVNEIDSITNFLSENEFLISKWLEVLEYNTKSVFQKHQIEEEILKYRLLSKDEKWKELIITGESNQYFEGQLNFWFYNCDIEISKEKFSQDYYSESFKNVFKEMTNRMSIMFYKDRLNRTEQFKERIFERALLSKSDYLLNEGGYKCFGRNSGRDVSWKRLFLRDRNNEQTNIALKEIFKLDFNIVNTSFAKYIKSNLKNYKIVDWRKAFVDNKILFTYLGSYKYIRKIENHGWVIIKDDYKTYTGAHYELFTLNFYCKHLLNKVNNFIPFNEVNYYPAPKNNFNDLPCVYLNWNTLDFEYALNIRYINDKFNLFFFTRTTAINLDISSVLLECGFKNFEHGYIIELTHEFETLTFIQNFVKKLT